MHDATKFWIAPHQGLPLQAGELAEFPRRRAPVQSAFVFTVTALGCIALGAFMAVVVLGGMGLVR